MLAVTASTTPPTAPAIEVDALAKAYGEVEAVRGVSFTVARGEVFGFLGPNGAGKSTTINMLCTLARPTSGTGHVSGFDVPVGQPVRPLVTGATPPSAADLPRRAAELVAAAAEGCDALVATGVMPAGVWL